ncbi:nucleotidyltransferase [Vulcanisaeta sp. JCM 16159]|uniref:nucleotidyltransferase n=1 Tax=Vulcanisaeta sp. JCM 16159 TaxID=1295371 RepID=UPI000ADD436E
MGSNQSKETVDLIRKALVKVGSELSKRGVDFVLIGSAVLPLLYGIDWNVHDIDVFITNKSTITEPKYLRKSPGKMIGTWAWT